MVDLKIFGHLGADVDHPTKVRLSTGSAMVPWTIGPSQHTHLGRSSLRGVTGVAISCSLLSFLATMQQPQVKSGIGCHPDHTTMTPLRRRSDQRTNSGRPGSANCTGEIAVVYTKFESTPLI